MENIIILFVPLALLFLVVGFGLKLILGKNAYDVMVGILSADVIRAVFLFPFRLFGWFLRLLKLIP